MTTSFESVLSDVFDHGAEKRFVSVAEEQAAILAAKAGDEAATIALVYAYAPVLRSGVSAHTGSASTRAQRSHEGTLTVEDAQMTAVSGLLHAIQEWTPEVGERLAVLIRGDVADALSEESGKSSAVSIPARSLQRFYGILRRAGGDLDAGADLAPSHGMARESFHAIAHALRAWDSLDSARDADREDDGFEAGALEAFALWGGDDAFAAAEDRVMVEAAFRAVDEREDGVIRDAYGFSEYRPLPDGVIAERRGMSRSVVQRTRASGLGKMREVLAVDVEV